MCEYFKFETWNPTYGYHYNINNAQNFLHTQNKLQQHKKEKKTLIMFHFHEL